MNIQEMLQSKLKLLESLPPFIKQLPSPEKERILKLFEELKSYWDKTHQNCLKNRETMHYQHSECIEIKNNFIRKISEIEQYLYTMSHENKTREEILTILSEIKSLNSLVFIHCSMEREKIQE